MRSTLVIPRTRVGESFRRRRSAGGGLPSFGLVSFRSTKEQLRRAEHRLRRTTDEAQRAAQLLERVKSKRKTRRAARVHDLLDAVAPQVERAVARAAEAIDDVSS